jgi:hypothetical protein
MKNEKGIDDLFKHSLKDPVDETAFRESDWSGLDNMLDEDKRRGKVFWLPILGSVAAVLLAFFGWWLFKPQATNTQQITQMVAKTPVRSKSQATVSQQAQQQQVAVNRQPEKGITTTAKSNLIDKDGKTFTQQNKPQFLAGNLHNGKGNTDESSPLPGKDYTAKAPTFGSKSMRDTARSNALLAAIDPSTGPNIEALLKGRAQSPDITRQPAEAPVSSPKTGINALAVAHVVTRQSGPSAFHPQFALSVLAASEVNGVGSFQSTSKGTNVGLMFSAGVKKFSVSTGVNYSSKPYSLPFDQYHTSYQFKNAPEYVNADCRVLDIPINFGYQLYNRSSNKVTVGTGISSYIMMHESYTYDYGNTGTLYGPSYYAVKGKGKYLFSIMNLQATYERKVNSKVGLTLQPYLKVPLSDIGYSQVRVQTFGVAVGLNWNLNSLTKP